MDVLSPYPPLERERLLLFVVNPISGTDDKDGLTHTLHELSWKHGYAYAIYETTDEDDAGAIAKMVALDKPTALVAVGGDGTVALCGQIVLGTETPLGILPMGSGNGLSKDLGIPQTIEEAFGHLVEAEPRRIDTLRVNGKTCFHLADIGFNAQIVKRYDEMEGRGTWAYAKAALAEIGSFISPTLRIETDEETYEGQAFMAVIANTRSFGSNAVINPEGKEDDGVFEVCILEPFGLLEAPVILGRLYATDFAGGIEHSVHSRIIPTTKVVIEVLPCENGIFLQIDGEPLGEVTRVEAEILPGSLWVRG